MVNVHNHCKKLKIVVISTNDQLAYVCCLVEREAMHKRLETYDYAVEIAIKNKMREIVWFDTTLTCLLERDES